jgi:hypothetical protein
MKPSSTKPTPTQLALIKEGVTMPGSLYGCGGGRVIGDPRTIRALVKKGLAARKDFDWRNKAYLTRAAFKLVGAEPPSKMHPFIAGELWP